MIRIRSILQSAFTLPEILVVLAITAILIALMIPSIHVVRNRMNTQTTISNLRTLQQANLMFANDHGGQTVPPQVNGDYSAGMWFQNEAFLSYLGLVPTDRMWDEDWPEVAKSGHPSASPNQPPGKMDRQGSIGINLGLKQHWPNSNGTFNDLSVNVNHVKNPSRAMAFADAKDTWIRMDRADSWQNDDPPWYTMAIAYRNGAKADGTGGKAAVVFFDGHVELLTREQVIGNWELWIADAD